MLWKEKRRTITWGVRTHPALCALLHAARLQHSLCDLGPGDLGLRGPGRPLGQPQVCTREPAWASTASGFSGHSPGPVAIGAQAPLLRPACAVRPSARFLAAVSLYPPPPMPGVFLTFAGLSSLGFLPSLHSLHALQDHAVTVTYPEGWQYIWDSAGSPGPTPSRPQTAAGRGSCPQPRSRPAPNNTLTESLLCPLGIVSQKSLMSELCI